ncbi:MAG: hypothetical protein Kow0054_02350 [Deferrisoma sp.]
MNVAPVHGVSFLVTGGPNAQERAQGVPIPSVGPPAVRYCGIGVPLESRRSAPTFVGLSDHVECNRWVRASQPPSFPAFQRSSLPRHSGGRYRRMVSEFVTTDTLENAMAAPAITGLRSHPVNG